MAVYPYNGTLNGNEEKDLFNVCKWDNDSFTCLFIKQLSPDWIAQLARASSQYIKVAGSISGQGTYRNQPINA